MVAVSLTLIDSRSGALPPFEVEQVFKSCPGELRARSISGRSLFSILQTLVDKSTAPLEVIMPIHAEGEFESFRLRLCQGLAPWVTVEGTKLDSSNPGALRYCWCFRRLK